MKASTALLFLFWITTATALVDNQGHDDREEVADANLRSLFRSVAVAIPSQYTWQLPIVAAPSLQERFQLCVGERFAAQPSIASCTGVHVGKGMILTAAHCISRELDCEKYRWAFNYRTDAIGEVAGMLRLPETYQCKKILLVDTTLDVTLLQLERKARRKTKMRVSFIPTPTTQVYTVGSPMGLPLKYSGIARVQNQTPTHFSAPLDTFVGNSGSPLINQLHKMVGLFLGGHDNLKMTSAGCRETTFIDSPQFSEKAISLMALPEPFKRHIRAAQ